MRRMVLLVALVMTCPAWAEEAAGGSLYSAGAPVPSAPAAGLCSRVVYEPCTGAPRKKKRRRHAVRPVVKVNTPPASETTEPAVAVDAATPAPAPAAEVAQPYASVPEGFSLDFSRIQRTVARRVYGVSAPALFEPEAPPVVEASDFGLVVERRFAQPRKRK